MKAEFASCELCPRRCRIDRNAGFRGFCGAGDGLRLFRWGPHFGEEPPVTGKNGSGCIFFSRCTLKCVYCQNSPWSWKGGGEDVTVARLAEIMRDLALKDKVSNWNLVSPTPYLPLIREAKEILAAEGVSLPFVWNSSGYERTEILEEYRDLCDIALFDLRYSRNETAMRYSSAKDYVETARRAVEWAWKNTKPIVRVLVLPGHADEAIESLAFIANRVSREVPVSVMCQYVPSFMAKTIPPLSRGVTEAEYHQVVESLELLGLENGWTQGFGAADASNVMLGENMEPGSGTIR
ncbi:MAG: radical SAM protein [Kiritimatiellae bacterium]|nr:radical SAM protein [Kiritimatiellia bacterium]